MTATTSTDITGNLTQSDPMWGNGTARVAKERGGVATIHRVAMEQLHSDYTGKNATLSAPVFWAAKISILDYTS